MLKRWHNKWREKIKAYRKHRKDCRYWENKINEMLTGKEIMPAEYEREVKSFYKQYGLDVSTKWHKRYLDILKIQDVRFIPEDVFYVDIEPTLNGLIYRDGVDDKNMYDLLFKAQGVELPETVIRNINGYWLDAEYNLIGLDEAIKCCLVQEKIIVKKAVNSGGGENIRLLKATEITEEKLQKTFSDLGDNLVVQKVIKQHKLLNEIHSSSVNTIRIITIILNNEVKIVQALLRMGVDGVYVDNVCYGGMAVGIKSNGNLKEYAYTPQAKRQAQHINSGFIFKDVAVPYYQEVENMVKAIHMRFAQFRLISWDVAVTESGPVLIEFNLKYQAMDQFQICNEEPFFGELTEKVLADIFGKK